MKNKTRGCRIVVIHRSPKAQTWVRFLPPLQRKIRCAMPPSSSWPRTPGSHPGNRGFESPWRYTYFFLWVEYLVVCCEGDFLVFAPGFVLAGRLARDALYWRCKPLILHLCRTNSQAVSLSERCRSRGKRIGRCC